MSEEISQTDDAGGSMLESISMETARQRYCRSLKERVGRGEYWVDLDFLACLLVDSQNPDGHEVETERP